MVKYQKLMGSIILIEGDPLSGKTTMGTSLTMYLKKLGFNVQFFPSPYNDTANLIRFTDGKPNHLIYQAYMQSRSREIHRNAIRLAGLGEIVIIDGGFITDRAKCLAALECGYLSEIQTESLLSIQEKQEPDYIIRLVCSRVRADSPMNKVLRDKTGQIFDKLVSTERPYKLIEIESTEEIDLDPITKRWINDTDCQDVLNKLLDEK